MQTAPSLSTTRRSVGFATAESHQRNFQAALPLYLASLLVTLAGVGAVGVTISSVTFTPVWAMLAIVGHAVSLSLRRARVPMETVFYPVMVLGAAVVVQLLLVGSPLVGLEAPLVSQDLAMGTAILVGTLAVLRSFTLITNSSLVFSPVPGITMLALVGSTNPNAEVPMFFGLLVLGALFLTSYEAHLRRIQRTGRPASSLLLHLLTAWSATLGVAALALLFPLLLQPILGPLSPFSLPAVSRLQNLVNFTQSNSSRQAAVGQGPINLSPTPVYHVYSTESGLLRTDVLTHYTGRSWTLEDQSAATDLRSSEQTELQPPLPPEEAAIFERELFRFQLPNDPDRKREVPTRLIRQTIETKGFAREGVPAFGRIRELLYPRRFVNLHGTGALSGSAHQRTGQVLQATSEIPQYTPDQLRAAPPVELSEFGETETLELPNSTMRVQSLALNITKNITNPYDKVLAILAYIEKTCTYTLQEEPTPPGEDAAEFYLFETKRGACDLAATAAAVMCRAVGIPARIALGYVAEEPLPTGDGYLIRHEHGHMWVEAYFPGYGWIEFNPSPSLASIRENPFQVLWYRLSSLLRLIGGGGLDAILVLTALFATTGLVGYTGSRQLRKWIAQRADERRLREESPATAIAFVYAEALRSLERRGWGRSVAETPTEYLARLRGAWSILHAAADEPARATPAALAALERLTEIYQQARYAGHGSGQLLAEATAVALELRRLTPRNPDPSASRSRFPFRFPLVKGAS